MMLKKRRAYIVRNDGKIFDQGLYHFYIIDNEKDSFEFSLKQLFETNVDKLLWFYQNTGNINHKRSIDILVSLFLSTVDKYDPLCKGIFNIHGAQVKKLFRDVELFDLSDNEKIEEILEQQLILVNNNLNQEFLRFRTSDLYEFGDSQGIYFRVSSFNFDWFPIIWNIVNENKNFIGDVTISGDWQSGKGSATYKHKGQLIDKIAVEDFLQLSGKPIIEDYSICDSILAKGGSLFEAHMSNIFSLNTWAEYKRKEYRKINFFIN